jgi:hypothetical protein
MPTSPVAFLLAGGNRRWRPRVPVLRVVRPKFVTGTVGKCQICGRQFPMRQSNMIYCSRPCHMEGDRRRSREYQRRCRQERD